MAKKRRPKDFNYQDVKDKDITDPEGAGNSLHEFPEHVHKYDPELDELVYEVVNSPGEKAAKLRQGFGTAQKAHADMVAAREAKAAKSGKTAKGSKVAAPAAVAPKKRKRAAKPRNPKPKPVAAAESK